eukprot:g6869.t1
MRPVCRSTRRRQPPLPPPKIAALVVALSLALLVQQGLAFQASSNMFASTVALRRGFAAAIVRRSTQQPAHGLLANRRGVSAVSMAWGEDDTPPPHGGGGGRPVDRGFSTGGVVDSSFTDTNGGGRADRYPPPARRGGGSGSGGRLGGGWAEADSSSGDGGGRQERFSGGGGGRSGGYGGGGRRGGGGYEQRRRGRGRSGGWEDQAADSRGRGQGGGYDGDFDGRESRGRGGGSSGGGWNEGRGRGGGVRERGRSSGTGRSSYGGRESARGRGGRALGGRQGFDDGPSRAWTPESGGGGGEEMAWGAGRGRGGGGARRYAEDDRGDDAVFGAEEEGWGSSRSSPASDWMRGELADYQAELSPNDDMDVDTKFDMVYGIAPVLNVLRNNRREKLGLYCQDGLAPANKKDRAAANQIYDLARETDVPMTTTDKGYLNTLCGNRPHQGFILKARPLQFEPILFLPRVEDTHQTPAIGTATTTASGAEAQVEEEGDGGAEASENAAAEAAAAVPKKQPPAPLAAASTGQVWLALDEVTDPQNFGALLRSAHFFGASGVVTCAKNSASLTATVSKSSAGAVEVMRVHSTANMMRFLKRSRENGWRVVGTCVSERSGPLHELPAGPGAPPTIVVLGNEGYGVRTNVLRECEFLVEVAGDGGGAVADGATASTVDSLNVSVTGGVMLFHLLAGAKHAAAYVAAAPGSESPAVGADTAAASSSE